MKSNSFENLEIYQLAERLSDRIWNMVNLWNRFSKDTVGKQLIRAADSVGANIAEGTGRGSYQDNRRFVRIARGSLYEARHWLRRSYQRNLIFEKDVAELKSILDELSPRLNAYLNSIGKSKAKIRSPIINDQQQITDDK